MIDHHAFDTAEQARKYLTDLGMHLADTSPHDIGDREYWAYGDGTDALLNHTATITCIEEGHFHVSMFKRKSKQVKRVTVNDIFNNPTNWLR